MQQMRNAKYLLKMTALPLAVLLCSLFLLYAPAASANARKPGEPLIRVFLEWFQSPSLNMRLGAYFLSAGLPERPEHTKILRERIAGAEPLERIVALYALAVMTRAPEDIDAFLEAFPKNCSLLYDLLDAEAALSATLNTGMADFLLLLVHEPHTRDKALPPLARIACASPANEFMNAYVSDPFVRDFLDSKGGCVQTSCPDYTAKDFSSGPLCVDSIHTLIKRPDLVTRTTAILMTRRLFDRDSIRNALNEAFNPQGEASWQPLEKLLAENAAVFYLRSNLEDFFARLPNNAESMEKLLRLEKELYRPPLNGIVSDVLRMGSDPRARELLRTVLRDMRSYLETIEIYRIQHSLQGE